MFKLASTYFLLVFWLCISDATAQTYFSFRASGGGHQFYRIQLEPLSTSCAASGSCDIAYSGLSVNWGAGVTMTPEGKLYGICHPNAPLDRGIYEIDTLDGSYSMAFDLPNWPAFPSIAGLVGIGGGIFYITVDEDNLTQGGDSLYQIDINSGSMINLGEVPFDVSSDIAAFNGQFYFIDRVVPDIGLINLDISNPSNSFIELPNAEILSIHNLTGSSMCNYLVGTREIDFFDWEIVLLNLVDGDITSVCIVPNNLWQITSMYEHLPPECEITIDLD